MRNSAVMEFIKQNFKDTIKFNTRDEGNLIGLPYPYTTPCADEKFTEMYYWDTYFTNAGLIAAGNTELAKNNTDNIAYLINKYGYMPNGNRTYYLQNTQPPFYYKMVDDVFAVTDDKEWLKQSYKTIVKEYGFWQTERIAPNGLNVYSPKADFTKEFTERKYNYFKSRYKGFEAESEEEKIACAHTIMTQGESGWDCTTRFENSGEFYNPIDLNSLLYGLEKTMEKFAVILENGEELLWEKRAESRKNKMFEILLDKSSGIFLDWNYKDKHFSPVFSVASLYPMFVGIAEYAESTVKMFSEKLMEKYGVTGCEKGDFPYGLQWDYPNVWAPLQFISYIALKSCGYDEIAENVAEKYIALIDLSFAETGNLWEKYDGRTGEVANADYNSPKMMGWTAGVYMYFSSII